MRWKCGVSIAMLLAMAACGGADGKNGPNGENGTNGANAYVSLIKTTTVASGDANCSSGGTRLDTGLDNGDGGGTAGDNTLQDGEIDSTQYVCNDKLVEEVDAFALPDGAAGTFAVISKGGDGTGADGIGGNAGYVHVYASHGSNGGHIKVAKTGLVDASVTIPAVPETSDYGVNPLIVASGTQRVKHVAVITNANDVNGDPLAAGDIVQPNTYGCGTYYNLYRWNSTSSANLITGVHVQAGATLVFDHNNSGSCPFNRVHIVAAIRNEGTIGSSTDTTSGSADTLEFQMASYIGTVGSAITTKSAVDTGGSGGAIELNCKIADDQQGSLWNFGTIDSTGADGMSGGLGGTVSIWADNQVINTGAITAKGGNATDPTGTAGAGGSISIRSLYGVAINTGTLDTSGGGGGATGGYAASLAVYNDGYGDTYNTGELRAIGGAPGDTCAAACNGGSGGHVTIRSATGDLHHSAKVSTYGGNGKTGTGGEAGNIDIGTSYATSLQTSYYNSGRGSVFISGDLDAHGGDGAVQGRNGGHIDVSIDPNFVPFGQQITMYGYGSGIDARGGDGTAQAGDGGDVIVYQQYGYAYSGKYVPGGAVVNSVDVMTKGGDSTSGEAGGAGELWLYTNRQNYDHTGFERVINSGNLSTDGGNGITSGGNANVVYLYGLDGAENHGTITANAGSASAGNGGACSSTEWYDEGSHGISVVSDGGSVANSGALSNNGGNGAGAGYNGGSSGGILVWGYTTENSGALSANGGNGDTASGYGGNGGPISVRASTGSSANTASSMTATGGAGSTGNAGTSGLILVDGQ